MKSLIDRLVREWAWRVNNGMPDPKNRNHLAVLADVFRSMKYSEQFISEYISQLSEVDDENSTSALSIIPLFSEINSLLLFLLIKLYTFLNLFLSCFLTFAILYNPCSNC